MAEREVSLQGSSLCARYIRSRLKRSGIYRRNLGLKSVPGDQVVNEVAPWLFEYADELVRMHPLLYERTGGYVGWHSFATEQDCYVVLLYVMQGLRRGDLGEWHLAKVIKIYAMAGGMAVDCVLVGKPEFLATIQRAMTTVLEESLAAWIQANGGWVSYHLSAKSNL